MATLAFIGNSEPPDKLLRLFRKFTPGRLGKWGQLVGVDSYDKADYIGVIDCIPGNLKHLESKCIFLGAHPPESHYAYCCMDSYKGFKMFDCASTIGFLEWWINYDYDYLKALQPMTKNSNLCAIVSNANTQSYHRRRRIYLERFCCRYPLNLYGRIQPWGHLKKHYKGHCGSPKDSAEYNNDHMSGKESVYENHKYALEFDAVGEHYFSERILDCLLLWCYPIYYGCRNLHKYIPPESFSYINMDWNGEDIMKIMEANMYEKALPYMAEARNILLDKLQVWPRIHEAIFGTNI